MDTSTSSVKFADEFATVKTTYKKRPPTPTRVTKKFELGELENESSSVSKSSRLNPDVEREEMALKDELLRIFGREKDAMETHYLGKIHELLRSFKGKKLEWEEMVRAEREDLERQFEQERTEIHQSFAQEITKMTRTFQEEKNELERKFETKQQNRERELEREKNDLAEKWRSQIDITRRECQKDYETKLELEMKRERETHKTDMELLTKKMESAQFDLERRHEKELADVETKFQKIVLDMERKFEDEKTKLEKDWQRKVDSIEDSLRKETNYRIETEKLASHDKENLKSVNTMLKDEINRLKEELERLRKLPLPQPEIKIIEKFNDPPPVSYNTRADLPGNLRDDFDRIINQYKTTLKEKFDRERVSMEERTQLERERMQEKIARQKEELDKKLNEEKFRMERDLDKSKDDIEKEIERRLRTKQLSESLLAQQQRFDDVVRRLEEEEKTRYERLRETEFRQFETKINELCSENDTLKAKVVVLEDTNKVLKNLKEEGQREVDRLRKAVEELRILVETRSDKTRAQTPAEFTPLLMSMMHQQNQQQQDDPISQKSQLDELSSERKKLEELKNDLQRQEREIRERRTMEDAARMAVDKSHEKYDSLLQEKRKLERQLQTLESRVVNMQDEFVKLRTQQNQPAQPIIVHPQSPTKDLKESPVKIINYPPGQNSQQQTTQQQSPQQQQPQSNTFNPFYMQSLQHLPSSLFSPNDQSEKINKLKAAKERLSRQVEDLQKEIRDANHENSLLQKQCQEYERRLDKVANALEREQELSLSLKDALSEEKLRVEKLKDDLERESENVVRGRAEMEELRINYQQEIQELQTKLHSAGLTLATVRQQAANEISAANNIMSNNYAMQQKDATVGYATLTTMPPMPPYYTVPSRRKMNLNRTADSFTAADLDQVRTLEEEKIRLQRQLQDAKGALNAYAGKLGQQMHCATVDYCRKPPTPTKHCDHNVKCKQITACNTDVEKVQQQQQQQQHVQHQQHHSKHLRQQKVQLQKLIERLTYLGPTQQ